MNTEESLITADDTEGHNAKCFGGAEMDETDTEGHSASCRFADAEASETDNTDGHQIRFLADATSNETDDTEGHTLGGVFADWESDKKKDTEEPGVHCS